MHKEKLFWRNHTESGSWVRVWREDWFGDQFEVLNADSFRALKELVPNVEFVDCNGDDD